MKSDKWLEYKGFKASDKKQAEIERIDSVKPEESFILHKEFYSPENTVFTEEEKGPKISFMAS